MAGVALLLAGIGVLVAAGRNGSTPEAQPARPGIGA